MKIRDARVEDAEGIGRVHVESWRTTYAGIIPQSYLDGLSADQRAGFWRKTISAPPDEWAVVLVAEDDAGEIVGFAAGGKERLGNAIYTAELGAIYLLKARQGKGTGRKLVAGMAARMIARGHNAMLLWVLEANPAVKFYEALGGTEIGRQEVEIGGATLAELAYGWEDIGLLAAD